MEILFATSIDQNDLGESPVSRKRKKQSNKCKEIGKKERERERKKRLELLCWKMNKTARTHLIDLCNKIAPEERKMFYCSTMKNHLPDAVQHSMQTSRISWVDANNEYESKITAHTRTHSCSYTLLHVQNVLTCWHSCSHSNCFELQTTQWVLPNS